MELIKNCKDENPEIFEALTNTETAALTVAAAVHQSMDWDTWGGLRYWDQLKERMTLARIAGPTSKDWWIQMCASMNLYPTVETAKTVTPIIKNDTDNKIQRQLTEETDWIITLLRICVDTKNKSKKTTTQLEGQNVLL